MREIVVMGGVYLGHTGMPAEFNFSTAGPGGAYVVESGVCTRVARAGAQASFPHWHEVGLGQSRGAT